MKRKKVTTEPSVKAIENCQSKAWFKSEADAREAAELRMLDNMSVELDIYKCNICQNWHLTRVNKLV